MAPSCINASSRRPIIPDVSGVSAVCKDTMSADESSVSRSISSMPSTDRIVRFDAITRHPKPFNRAATACPMGPSPIRPTVAPLRSVPRSKLGFQPSFQAPDRISASPSATRRPTPNMSASVRSAVLSVKTPGVCPTMTPCSAAASTSMWSTPTETVEITFSC